MSGSLQIDSKEEVGFWDGIPKWKVGLATLPSSLAWLNLFFDTGNPILAAVLILTSGIAMGLPFVLYAIFWRIVLNKHISMLFWLSLFLLQCFIYGSFIYFSTSP